MSRTFFPSAPLAALTLGLAACSAPAPGGHARIGSLGAPIQSGADAAGQSNVVGLQGVIRRNADGSLNTLLCTGSLIAPNLVLTARHCIARVASTQVTCGKAAFEAPLSPGDVFVTTEDEMPGVLDRYLETQEILVPDEGNDVCGFDVALIILRRNVPAAVAEPLEPRLDDVVEAGEAYRAVGFGATSGDDEGAEFSGVRRERTGLSATCIEVGGGECSLSSGNEWEGEAGVCEGDSGGPAIDGRGRVIGVASRTVFSDGGDCLTPVYGAVTGWRDWIREVARRAADEGGYEPATWVTSGGPLNGGSGGGQTTNGSSSGGRSGSGSNATAEENNDGCAVRAPGSSGAAPWLLGAALAAGSALRSRRRRR